MSDPVLRRLRRRRLDSGQLFTIPTRSDEELLRLTRSLIAELGLTLDEQRRLGRMLQRGALLPPEVHAAAEALKADQDERRARARRRGRQRSARGKSPEEIALADHLTLALHQAAVEAIERMPLTTLRRAVRSTQGSGPLERWTADVTTGIWKTLNTRHPLRDERVTADSFVPAGVALAIGSLRKPTEVRDVLTAAVAEVARSTMRGARTAASSITLDVCASIQRPLDERHLRRLLERQRPSKHRT
jgi:hypothetical protein